jgi:methyl-accepting chemotaxis protein
MPDNNQYQPGGSQCSANDTLSAGDFSADSDCLERLTQSFEMSARRWELVIYPSLFAFIILASYGFYLIYSLTNDIHFMAETVYVNMNSMSQNIDSLANSTDSMSKNMAHVSMNMQQIATHVETMEPILYNMDSMRDSMQQMTLATTQLRNDIGLMNQSVSRPMSFVNSFMPW